MLISYVLVTLLIVLMLEALVVSIGLFIFTRTPVLGYFTLQIAGHAAQVYALQAALLSDGERLNPGITFAPGQATSLSLRSADDPPDLSAFNLDISYVEPGSPPPQRAVFAFLIDPQGRVMASSYPDRYPEAIDIAQALPDDSGLINAALAGEPGGAVTETPQGRVASVARPILSREGNTLGVVFIQSPAGGFGNTNLLAQVASILVPSAVAWLCLMLPIGAIFGVLTTRGLIRRVERLAGAAARFSEGDETQRVPVNRPDEIGQLERQFNQMAERIVDNYAERQALAEKIGRQEERARIEQEMKTARYIQEALLPERVPSIPGWQLEPFYRPARQVGGDFYDFLPLPDGRIGIVIGDGTGKGIPAALIMATTTTMLRAAAPRSVSSGEVLAQVNNLLQVHIPPNMFITCFYAILDPARGELCFANAGHNIPYLWRAGEISELRAAGMPLGLMPDQEYEEKTVTLATGERVLFYTDGLVEAHDTGGAMFGSPRLKQLLQDMRSPDGLIEYLLDDLQAFTGVDWEQEDDITLVLLRRDGLEENSP